MPKKKYSLLFSVTESRTDCPVYVSRRVITCVAVGCTGLQCVAVCCGVLQCVAVSCGASRSVRTSLCVSFDAQMI